MRSLLVLAPLFLITFACQTTQTNTAQANVDYSHNYKYSYRNTHVKTIDQPILTNDGIEMLPNGVTQNDKSSFKQSAFELITHPSTGQLVKVTLIETRQIDGDLNDGALGSVWGVDLRGGNTQNPSAGGQGSILSLNGSIDYEESQMISVAGDAKHLIFDYYIEVHDLKITDPYASFVLHYLKIERAEFGFEQLAKQKWQLKLDKQKIFCGVSGQEMNSNLTFIASNNSMQSHIINNTTDQTISVIVDENPFDLVPIKNDRDNIKNFQTNYFDEDFSKEITAKLIIGDCEKTIEIKRKNNWKYSNIKWKTIYSMPNSGTLESIGIRANPTY